MCGIFAIYNAKNNAQDVIYQGLKKLEYRGYDSWGITVLNKRKLITQKDIGAIGQAKITLPVAKIGIGHTRWATNGKVNKQNAHPQLDCKSEIAVVHNGIVENAVELKSRLQKDHHYASQTDTETIAHIYESEKVKNKSTKAFIKTVKQLSGFNAIILIDSKQQQLLAFRNGSPMIIGRNLNTYYIASDINALIGFAKQIAFLEDDDMISIEKDKITSWRLKTNKSFKLIWQDISSEIQNVSKGKYPHFTLKEIMQQPQVISRLAAINKISLLKLTQKLKTKKLIITGCGSANHCGILGKYFLAENINVQNILAHEFTPFQSWVDKNTVLLAISQSGETIDTLEAVRMAKKHQGQIVSLCNVASSTLSRIADNNLSLAAGPEIGVVSTKAFTAQASVIYLLHKALSDKFSQGENELNLVAQNLQCWLSNTDNLMLIQAIATKLIKAPNIYVLGKNIQYPGALEFALKIEEISYISTQAFAAGELKHGPLSLIEKNVPCIVLLDDKSENTDILTNATEVKSRGGFLIGVGLIKDKIFDEFIKTPDLGELSVLGNIIVGQLIGYYLAVKKGLNPDQPRNLAKSVTVK